MLSSRGSVVLLIALLAFFAVGMARVLRLRYEQGDVYPPYSSLRADPLGTKAFYESLEELPAITVTRLFQSLDKLGSAGGKTLFVFGVSGFQLRQMDEGDFQELHRFLSRGGRAVFALFPEGGALSWTNTEEASPPARPKGRRHFDTNENDSALNLQLVSLEKKYGFVLKASPLLADEDKLRPEQAHVAGASTLPRLVSWNSAIYFDELEAPWEVIYRRKDKPVLIERKVGGGSFVLASDSYFTSNEALRKERHPELLAWLTGGRRDIVFDETHLGVEEHPGVVTLARKYHLEGLAAGLAVMAILLIWRDAFSFLPPYQDPVRAEGLVQGRDAATGLMNLLRRNVASADILKTCVLEWKRCPPNRAAVTPERLAAMEQIVAEENAKSARGRSPVDAYRALQRLLRKKA